MVAPGVLAAMAGAAGLLAGRPAAVSAWAPPSELALLAVVLISTAAWQARQHGRLAEGFDPVTHRLLVQTNWLRVAAWSAAGIIALWMCHQAFRP